MDAELRGNLVWQCNGLLMCDAQVDAANSSQEENARRRSLNIFKIRTKENSNV